MNQSFVGALRAPWLLTLVLCVTACGDDDASETAPEGEGPASTCSDALACAAGQVCEEGTCVAASGAALRVVPAARGCEVLLEDTETAKIASAQFSGSARGSYLRRAPRTAVSFIATSDEPIGASDARVLFAGQGQPKLLESECVGADGKKLSGVAVSLSN